MKTDDLTLHQARDLARYFLGPEWTVGAGSGEYILFSSRGQNIAGRSWQRAFLAAGVCLPTRVVYASIGTRVMLVDKAICTAVSNTMAKRIATALNNHTPDRRGI